MRAHKTVSVILSDLLYLYRYMDNYEVLPNGVIKQRVVQKISYTFEYSNKYNAYGEKGKYLSYLRYGVLLGALQRTPTRLTDVGYGNGDFLRACSGSVKELYGCDLSDYPVPEGCTKILLTDISNMDVTCFFDSLEHFDDITVVKNIDTKYVFISVPWCHSASPEWFLPWYHRRENEHLFHFNEASLQRFFDECGYDCIYSGCFEDVIRKNPSLQGLPNILSCIFKKR
jgi:hypothetical protein